MPQTRRAGDLPATDGDTTIDHLVVGVPDLHAGRRFVEEHWGLQPLPGGRHPAWGSWNVIVPLEAGVYLELIAPHPDPPPTGAARVFGLDRLTQTGPGEDGEPVALGWALRPRGRRRAADILARVRAAGVDMGDLLPGQRRLDSGEWLTWELSDPYAERMGSVFPFLLDWGSSPHPSGTGDPQGEVTAIEMTHPQAGRLEEGLAALSLAQGEGAPEIRVRPGDRPALVLVCRFGDREVRIAGPTA